MKKLLFLFALAMLVACSADYDTFGTSDYRSFNEISFDEQSNNTTVYSDEHKMLINLDELPDSISTWDSVTISNIDVSSLARLYLVESKFKEFPKDSASLDSLAKSVSYASKALKNGDKIRLPASQIVYVIIVSESGIPSIWQLEFTIPGKIPEKSDNDSDNDIESSDSADSSDSNEKKSDTTFSINFENSVDTKVSRDTIYVVFAEGTDISKIVFESSSYDKTSTISTDPAKVKDWSKPQSFTITAEDGSKKTWVVVVSVILRSGVDLILDFENKLKSPKKGDTIAVMLKNGSVADISEAVLIDFSLDEGASISPDPKSVKKWSSEQSFVVTAENGSKKTWVVTLEIAAADFVVSTEKELKSVSAKGESEKATIDVDTHEITLHFESGVDLSAVELTFVLSKNAYHNLGEAPVDLRTSKTFKIFAEDESFDSWTIKAEVNYSDPKITAMKIGGVSALIDQDAGTISVSSLALLADLTSIEISDVETTSGTTLSIKSNFAYDLSSGMEIEATVPSGAVKSYVVRAGYQYTNNSFTSWNGNVATGWANGNTAGFNMTSPSSGSAKMESMNAKILGIGQFASGNLFTGSFNPKGVGATKMMGYKDGNELIDFGTPFKARPTYVEFDFTYEGKGDSCDMYIFLENRTNTIAADVNAKCNYMGCNVKRSSSDVNTLVASAWYRSTTQDNTGRKNPDVVSITKGESGFMTLRMKLKYGTPDPESAIYNSNTFKATLESSDGIDNHLIEGTGKENVTHLRIVMASSADGNHYKGTVGAKLIVGEVRLIY